MMTPVSKAMQTSGREAMQSALPVCASSRSVAARLPGVIEHGNCSAPSCAAYAGVMLAV